MNAVVVLAGLAAIVVLAVLAGSIVWCVVRKARAEDLPQILTGLSQIVEATTGFLPWRGQRTVPVAPLIPAPRTAPEDSPSVPEPRTVSGTVVTVTASTAVVTGDLATALPQRTLPVAPESSGGTQ